VRAPMYSTAQFGDMPLLDVSASYDAATGKSGVFIVNRSQTESMTIDLNWQDRTPRCINAVDQLSGTDPKAANSFENPNAVISQPIAAPVLDGNRTTFVVPPLSFTALDISF